MKIVVSGVSGMIGKSLALHLLKEMHEVWGLARSPQKVSFLPPTQIAEWDGVSLPPLEVLANAQAIVHLAGEPVANGRWTEKRKKEIYDSRIKSTNRIVESIRALPPEQRPEVFIAASAIGYYGDRGDESLDEASASSKNDFLAKVCEAWELAAKPLETLGVRVVWLRTGVVLGREGGALAQMKPVILGTGKQWVSWIHIEDEVRLIEFLIESNGMSGVFNLVAPEPVQNKVFTEALAKAIRFPVVTAVPGLMIRTLLGQMASVVLASQRVYPVRALKAGFQFKFTNIDQALADLYQEHTQLDHFFTSAQFIAKPKAEVFQFFSRAENLETITPGWLNFKVLYQSTPAIEDGTFIDYHLKIHGIPVTWQSRIARWQPEEAFVDYQTRGPYSKWYHEHRFYAVKGGTLITDEVTYRIPGNFPGNMALGPWIKRDIQKIFAYRSKAIAGLFASES